MWPSRTKGSKISTVDSWSWDQTSPKKPGEAMFGKVS